MTYSGLFGWGDVAIGAAVRTGENAVDALADLRARWARSETGAEELRRRLAERGAVERGRALAAGSEFLDRIVDGQLGRVLRLLEKDPERIRVLVRRQRETIVDDVVEHVRAGAAAGDAAVDRFTLRMGRREPTDAR
jgi:hypothetical protein